MYDGLVEALRLCAKYGKAEDALENAGQAADAIETLCEIVATAHGELANVIQSYEESKPRWIPVEERFPDDGVYVLVRYKSNDMAVACVFDRDENFFFWRAQTDDGWCADCDTEPTHWMPLPEPPTEVNEA